MREREPSCLALAIATRRAFANKREDEFATRLWWSATQSLRSWIRARDHGRHDGASVQVGPVRTIASSPRGSRRERFRVLKTISMIQHKCARARPLPAFALCDRLTVHYGVRCGALRTYLAARTNRRTDRCFPLVQPRRDCVMIYSSLIGCCSQPVRCACAALGENLSRTRAAERAGLRRSTRRAPGCGWPPP